MGRKRVELSDLLGEAPQSAETPKGDPRPDPLEVVMGRLTSLELQVVQMQSVIADLKLATGIR